jgi:hypothetical protein
MTDVGRKQMVRFRLAFQRKQTKLPATQIYHSPRRRPRPGGEEGIEQPAHESAFVGDDIGL